MIKSLKKVFAALLVTGAFLIPIAVPVGVSAQSSPDIEGPLCQGAELNFNPESGACAVEGDPGTRLTGLIKTIINIISVVVGVVAVIMIVIGGLKYITSGGDSSNVSSAKNTILYAIIGLVIVALAQFIVRFVLERSIDAGGGPVTLLPVLLNLV